MSFSSKVWATLAGVDVSAKIEKKGGLSYLSWAWAWGELMKCYPASTYEFKDLEIAPDGCVTVWVDLTVSDGTDSLMRTMWLPVMDHKNAAILKPNARKISDTRMRCLVKAIAMFGLGHYIYAGEDLPEPEMVEAKLSEKYAGHIKVIKEGIEFKQYSTAAEAWFELNEDEMTELWRAPSKGGVFTTAEREVMKSSEFRKSYYGEDT